MYTVVTPEKSARDRRGRDLRDSMAIGREEGAGAQAESADRATAVAMKTKTRRLQLLARAAESEQDAEEAKPGRAMP